MKDFPALDTYLRAHGIQHFAAKEVATEEDFPPQRMWPNILPVLTVLEWVRMDLRTPLYITCGYRSAEHNARVGGAPHSMHLQFAAVDFHDGGIHTPRELAEILDGHPDRAKMGLGVYRDDGHCHVDVRGSKARWSVPEGFWP